MSQGKLFEELHQSTIVNVATVPLRSPFRYPGGKTWLIPTIRRWLRARSAPVAELIEPFAGGAIVGLTAVFEGLAQQVTLVELDQDVAAVWQVILNGQGQKLADEILSFELSHDAVQRALAVGEESTYRRAFATILRNRITRGGILAPGAGLIKHGENGKGLGSRWYPQTIRKRIIEIIALREHIRFIHGDGLQVIRENLTRRDVVFFIDPPYVVAGRRLYRNSEIDHALLFEIASEIKGDFLITYDNADEIQQLATRYGFDTRLTPMKNTHHDHKLELLIGRDLRWVDN